MTTNASRIAWLRSILGGLSQKQRTLYADYGYPERPGFEEFYQAFSRVSVCSAAIEKIVDRTWKTEPYLLDGDEVHEETSQERELRERFESLRLWQKLSAADLRSMVGGYAGVIFRFADGQPFDKPVTRVPGGLDGVVDLIPAYSQQLQPVEWDTDTMSPTYGEPTSYQFQESAVTQGQNQQQRALTIHPDRVLIWSPSGTVYEDSPLKAGLNDLIDYEKVKGAAGESFWKVAKQAPILDIDKDTPPHKLAQMLNVDISEIGDKLNELVEAFNTGLDATLALQGIKATTLQSSLPAQPEKYALIPLQAFASRMNIPLRLLVGNETGERASTEDDRYFSESCMSRRARIAVPLIREMVDRFVRYGILPDRPWRVDWEDLTEASIGEKIERAERMAKINQANIARGEVFTPDEIREVTGHEPLDEREEEGLEGGAES